MIWGVSPGTAMQQEPAESSAWGECQGGHCQLGDKVVASASGELVFCACGLSCENLSLVTSGGGRRRSQQFSGKLVMGEGI